MKVKCKSCGAFVDVKGDELTDGDQVSAVLVTLVLLATLANGFWAFDTWRDKKGYRSEIEAEYKDECWVAEIQKEIKVPKPTSEERWCEAHGHCGPARETLASELGDCREEMRITVRDHNRALTEIEQCRYWRKENEEHFKYLEKEIGFYNDRCMELYCAEQMHECEYHLDGLHQSWIECEDGRYDREVYLGYLAEEYRRSHGEGWSKEKAMEWYREEEY